MNLPLANVQGAVPVALQPQVSHFSLDDARQSLKATTELVEAGAFQAAFAPKFPDFIIDSDADFEFKDGMLVVSLIHKYEKHAYVCIAVNAEEKDDVAVVAKQPYRYGNDPDQDWCDVSYSYPVIKNPIGIVWDADDVPVHDGAIVALTDDQISAVNEHLSTVAYEDAA